jgi:nucleoside-diphosphate-sugar epimerase
MRLLITGATGFIGLHLCRRLLADGHHLVTLVRTPSKLPPDVAGQVEVLQGDLALFEADDCVLPEVDVVVHLAAVVAGKNEAEYAAINHAAVAHLLACLQRQAWRPQRFVFVSSLAAAGPSPAGTRWTEDDAPRPIDPYGDAKLRAEALVRAQPFPTTIVRPPIVLGPGDPASLTLYRMARMGVAFLPWGPPQVLSWVDVADLVEALRLTAMDGSDAHRTYYTASDDLTTNRELLKKVAAAQTRRLAVLPLPRALLWIAMVVSTALARVFGFKNQLDRKQYTQMVAPAFACTSARLTADTEWRATRSLDETLARSVEGYRSEGLL